MSASTRKRSEKAATRARATLEATRIRAEQAALAVLVHRQRQERLAIAEQHQAMIEAVRQTAAGELQRLEARHLQEWFEHRQQFGHELGPAAEREGRA